MSADGNHDEAFWQHCADDTIKHYKGVLEVSFSVITPPLPPIGEMAHLSHMVMVVVRAWWGLRSNTATLPPRAREINFVLVHRA